VAIPGRPARHQQAAIHTVGLPRSPNSLIPQYKFYLSYHRVSGMRKMSWWTDFLSWPTIFATQLIIVLATLLTVRSCGYRLVRSTTVVLNPHA